jgi:hypothetical protein
MLSGSFKESRSSILQYNLLEEETLESALAFLNIVSSHQPQQEIGEVDVELVLPIYAKFDEVTK